ncbi:PaREP1 family protein [Acidianus ambivalens]|uniref:Superfamily I DNA and RNA helicase and helicaseubunit n=1 Tax=Acidianus ambivalens TaxID=2283 RepID=A0A650CWT5_ACIAM|nr:PaREP1 family protein [Acidianus ambivalens]MQL54428.1 superfamily I DNA and RNA helicase and helicaseubunit [Acidianus ambivalens]QGR22248.1 superfamily I DNA and RNA helicase and helicaseubunit [Acidianus ambivalens]
MENRMPLEEVIRKLEEKGIDVTEALLDILSREDPEDSSKERISLAEKYMQESKECAEKGDVVQASEKAYKVAEEVVKALAEKFKTEEYEEFLKEGRWYTYLLGKASKTLSKKLGYWVLDGWNAGYDLHVWGFHERKYSVEDVKVSLKRIEEMLIEAKKLFT